MNTDGNGVSRDISGPPMLNARAPLHVLSASICVYLWRHLSAFLRVCHRALFGFAVFRAAVYSNGAGSVAALGLFSTGVPIERHGAP
jgi:hypothetical protein